MKVVFLDIDGVLNNEQSPDHGAWAVNMHGHVREGLLGIDPVNLPPLRDLLDRSGAQVVLSSTWRLGSEGFSQTTANLWRAGMRICFAGLTPRIGTERGHEIQAWLDAWNACVPNDPVTHFVILDDSSDMAHLMPHLVRTDYREGLTMEHVEPVLRLLGVLTEGRA